MLPSLHDGYPDMTKLRTLCLAGLLACAAAAPAMAFFEPPITSERDAACREVARAKVFTAPDPDGVGLYETGKRIYRACMAAAPGKVGITKASQTR